MALDSVFSSFQFTPLLPSLRETLPRRLSLSSASDHHHSKSCITEQTPARSEALLLCGNDLPKEGIDPFPWTQLATRLHQHDESSNGLFEFGSTQPEWIPLLCLSTVSEDVESHKFESFNGFSVHAAEIESRKKQEDTEKSDFHINVGYAIRTLRDEMPSLFYKDISYDIYRQDIVLHVPMNIVTGINNYKLIFRALRIYGRMFFKALWLDIIRISQPSNNVIVIRWQVRGIPRVPWESQGIFDGTSEYKLDKEGKIYEHKVDNMALNARPKLKIPTVAELLNVEISPSAPRPTFFFGKAQEMMNVE